MKDLVVLAADRSIEIAIQGLLSRPKALKISPTDFETFTHHHRDPGCYHEAHDFLRPLLGEYRHALVLLDRSGSGSEESTSTIEMHVRRLLNGSGWDKRADAVVIDPELEVWVWGDSPKVDEFLHWTGRKPSLRKWIQDRGLWPAGQLKPTDPKRAVEMALREVNIPRSSSIYLNLARSVSVDRCTDLSFGRLRDLLRSWFPAQDLSQPPQR